MGENAFQKHVCLQVQLLSLYKQREGTAESEVLLLSRTHQ
jgi:hypothetical protein